MVPGAGVSPTSCRLEVGDSMIELPGRKWCPRRDSHPDFKLRRLASYLLDDEGKNGQVARDRTGFLAFTERCFGFLSYAPDGAGVRCRPALASLQETPVRWNSPAMGSGLPGLRLGDNPLAEREVYISRTQNGSPRRSCTGCLRFTKAAHRWQCLRRVVLVAGNAPAHGPDLGRLGL